ncbi:hypothetical protein MKK60_20930 [Methylobacterium sp. J-092]|nr:hypothetical protein [Methylobacterium sp. J-092]
MTPNSANWLLKLETATVRLGSMEALSVDAAREAAARAKADVKAGRSPKAELALFAVALEHSGGDVALSAEAAFPETLPEQSGEDRRRYGPWRWCDLVDEFLAHKLPRLKVGRWPAQYEGLLRHPAFSFMSHYPVAEVSLDDLTKARDAIRATSASQAARAVAQGKEMLSWAWGEEGPRSGLKDLEFPWWEKRWNLRYVSEPREHAPRLDEIVRTILIAERNLQLGGNSLETTPGTLAALWALVLTAQRAGALTGTRRATVRPWTERPGWMVWTWTGHEMKGGRAAGRPHAIPMPPEAVERISRFEVDEDSPFLFPSRVEGKHVTPVGITQFFDRLRGKTKAGRVAGNGRNATAPTTRKADLFEQHDIRPWVPHDLRRTMTAFLEGERLGGAASAILAHKAHRAAGTPDEERELMQAITLRHYFRGQRLELKAAGMEMWIKAILDAYDEEALKMDRAASVPGRAKRPASRPGT